MANSLIELYGGGMAGKSNNYQLGGRIASARRGREYQKEMRQLRQKAEAAARRKRKSGLLGSLGSIAGGALGFALAGPAGAAIGAGLGKGAGESTYAREGYGGGKYAKETRGDLRDVEDEYRRGIGERALVTGLQAAIMPGVYEKAGSWLKGLGGTKEAATAARSVGRGSPHINTTDLVDPTKVFPTGGQAAMLPQNLGAISQAATEGLGAYTGTAAQNLAMARELGLDLSGGQTVMGAYQDAGYGPWSTAMETYGDLFGRGGGWIPKMRAGGRALAEEMMNPTMGANLEKRIPVTPPLSPVSTPSPSIGANISEEETIMTPSPISAPAAPLTPSPVTMGANITQDEVMTGALAPPTMGANIGVGGVPQPASPQAPTMGANLGGMDVLQPNRPTPPPSPTMGANLGPSVGESPVMAPPPRATMGANLGKPDRPQIGMPSAPSPIPAKGREGIVPKPEGFPTPTSPIGSPIAPTAGANLGQIDSVAGQDLTPDLSGTDFSALQGLSGSDMVFGGSPLFDAGTDFSGVYGDTLGPTGTGTGTGTDTGAGAGTGTTGTGTGTQDLTPDLSGTDFSGLQGLSGTDIVFGGDPIFGSDTDWSMTGSNLFGLKGAGALGTSPTGGTTPSAPIGGAYGTAIGAQSALHQMGMGDVADDPRLQKYLEDLPQFSQGYRQQFGDIQRGGRQALQQMYAAQRLGGGAAGGFAGAGAGGQAFQQQLGGLRSDIGRQRRGVVEGFQSDLLSAIGDIEAKGEFEFGAEEASSKLAKAQQLAEQGGVKGMAGRALLKKLAAQGIVPQANQGNVANPTQLDTFQDTQDMDAYYDQQYG